MSTAAHAWQQRSAEGDREPKYDERNPPPEYEEGSKKNANEWPEELDLEALAEKEPEPPQFIIPNWFPVGYATLLAGHGGVGKSYIALILAVCIALGIQFFGLQVQRRRVLYLACEDRANVIHWRLSRICAYLKVNMASLRGWLSILDLVEHNTVLYERDPRTGYTTPPAIAVLEERMCRYQSQVLMVDGISDTFFGIENGRVDPGRYVKSLVSLTPSQDGGAVLLLGHIPKPTARGEPTTEGYSGNTAWHNAVRARWYLYPETEDSGNAQQQRTGDLILGLQKSNHGGIDGQMRFTWNKEAHLFVGQVIEAEGAFERSIRERTERDGIVAAFAACGQVPAATSGIRTTYQVLKANPAFPDSLRGAGKPEKQRFWRLIEELRATGKIREIEGRSKDRHPTRYLELAAP